MFQPEPDRRMLKLHISQAAWRVYKPKSRIRLREKTGFFSRTNGDTLLDVFDYMQFLFLRLLHPVNTSSLRNLDHFFQSLPSTHYMVKSMDAENVFLIEGTGNWLRDVTRMEEELN